jgi:hypothetical protein
VATVVIMKKSGPFERSWEQLEIITAFAKAPPTLFEARKLCRRIFKTQFEEAAEAEAQRGYEMYQLVPGSDVALALQALVGDDLIKIVLASQGAELGTGQ